MKRNMICRVTFWEEPNEFTIEVKAPNSEEWALCRSNSCFPAEHAPACRDYVHMAALLEVVRMAEMGYKFIYRYKEEGRYNG